MWFWSSVATRRPITKWSIVSSYDVVDFVSSKDKEHHLHHVMKTVRHAPQYSYVTVKSLGIFVGSRPETVPGTNATQFTSI